MAGRELTYWERRSIDRNWTKLRIEGMYNSIHQIVGSENLSIPDREILASTLPILRGIVTGWDHQYIHKLMPSGHDDPNPKKPKEVE